MPKAKVILADGGEHTVECTRFETIIDSGFVVLFDVDQTSASKVERVVALVHRPMFVAIIRESEAEAG